MKKLEYPLKGYPFTHQETETLTPEEKAKFIEYLVTAAAHAELLHKMTQAVYYDFMYLGMNTPNRTFTDRLEHSARILENVAFQLSELTTDAKKNYSDFDAKTLKQEGVNLRREDENWSGKQ